MAPTGRSAQQKERYLYGLSAVSCLRCWCKDSEDLSVSCALSVGCSIRGGNDLCDLRTPHLKRCRKIVRSGTASISSEMVKVGPLLLDTLDDTGRVVAVTRPPQVFQDDGTGDEHLLDSRGVRTGLSG
nr:hypothetical protein Iba_chr04eCG1700 [Ipomoea batatas]